MVAAATGSGFPSEVILLAQLVVLLLVGRLLGEAMTRVGQPSVMGMLLGGILLGPSGLGLFWPALQQAIFPNVPEQAAMLAGVAQFGILLLLLLTGMETDVKLVRRVGKVALIISAVGVAFPFVCGFVLGELMPTTLLPNADQRALTALFLGTALSISSIKIVAAVVREMGFGRRNLGQIIVASAVCEDSIGWVIVAITSSLAGAKSIDLMTVGRSVLGTAVFLAASFTVGRRVVFLLMRWVNDHFESDFPVITVILVIMGVMAVTTHLIGVHTVLGAFVAGVLVGQSPILSKHVDEQLRGLIVAFFMPVFFGSSGLATDLTGLAKPDLALITVAFIAVASVSKFAGAFIGGELGGLTRREALALGCGMNARGSTEVIVASIGLSIGALSHDLFTIIVVMAFITTMAMPPILRWALARVPLRKDEKERLEREAQEARQFLPNIERLLLSVDESANGRFTAQLAGLIAGSRSMPITVLPVGAHGQAGGGKSLASADRSDVADLVARSAAAAPHPQDLSSSVEVTVRTPEGSSAEAVAIEAKKGHDVLLVGMEKMKTRSGEFDRGVSRIVSAFDGPAAIVDARDGQLDHPQQRITNILVPISGTEISRRAAEVAIMLARAYRCSVTVLHVANTAATKPRRLRSQAGPQRRAIINEVAEMGARHGVKLRTALQSDAAPDQAILNESKRTDYGLLVMGASPRPGDRLFLGDTAAAIFLHSPVSLLFLVS